MKFLTMQYSPAFSLRSKYSSQHLYAKSLTFNLLLGREIKLHTHIQTTGTIRVLSILIFTFLDRRWQDKRFWTECSKHSLHLIWSLFLRNVILIYCFCFQRSPLGLNSLLYSVDWRRNRISFQNTLVWKKKLTTDTPSQKLSDLAYTCQKFRTVITIIIKKNPVT